SSSRARRRASSGGERKEGRRTRVRCPSSSPTSDHASERAMYMVTSGAHPISSNSGASHSIVDSTPSPPFHGSAASPAVLVGSGLGQGEHEQRVSLVTPEQPGEEALEPAAPPGRHGDVLPAVDLVRGRAAVVPAAALERPQLLAGLGVQGDELARRGALEDQAARRGQGGGAQR